MNDPVAAAAWRGRRGKLEKGVQEQPDAEIVHRAAEKHRCEPALFDLLSIKLFATHLEQLDLFLKVRDLALAESSGRFLRGKRKTPLDRGGLAVAPFRGEQV